MTAKRNEVRELRESIAALQQGRRPESRDVVYLRQRLADLTKSAAANRTEWDRRAEARRRHDALDAVLDSPARREIVERLATLDNAPAIKVVQRAVDEYAVRRGLGPSVHAMQQKERT